MRYEEMKNYLKNNPYCFRTLKEKEEEFDQRIMDFEGKKINFVKAHPKNESDYER